MAVKEFIDLPVTDLNKLLRELDLTARGLLETVAAFSQGQFNKIPFAGSWTAGQVSEHLLKSIAGIPELMLGNTRTTTERKGDEKVQAIESIFLDYDIKMKSPDFTLPSGGPHDRNELLNGLRTALDALAEKARTTDLTATCTDFPFPRIGELTRWEWICFAICHSKRHTLQLKNIYRPISPAVSFNGE
ncbi:DinB family protein [Pseudoflavitalea sp. X16]|uniref:DinB family protein n=1 Tax=Paraflavitalea devenefica TaxID=2716334 RepID=UPI001423DE10|nr:DinB family protein [Paraflavitalea devenefica]NII26587.1 DinB family protein [Paraflavitalea devenefica]